MPIKHIILGFLLAVLFLSSCSEYSYQKEVQRELSSDNTFTNLILDINFGMSSQEFFTYCAEMNKKGITREGFKSRSVEYQIDDFGHKIHVLFYPSFKDDKIVEMPMLFTYDQWAPWNKKLFSDKLILNIRELLGGWYDCHFHLIKDFAGTPGYVSVQGNRRVTISIQDDRYVIAHVTDMNQLEKPLEKLEFKHNLQ